ncbi:Fe-Mn family superoxide dismutase [Salinicola halophilus]|uniref:Fe-Mn family superoxide dismutase n=1 Tax=Salinicola halophilus TaxID=184065 RepID=UPI000DA16A33|nr:Fe-Mn family superoxide dismutase [Salinicola halophilus]
MTPSQTDFESFVSNDRPRSSPRFELPALPFERHSLEPAITRAQVDLLYSHYHRSLIDALNATTASQVAQNSLAELATLKIDSAASYAGEAWNLTVFWHGLTARPVAVPDALERAVIHDFGSWRGLASHWREVLQTSDAPWSWLTASPRGELRLVTTRHGEQPSGVTPLLAVALMPDAYRLDFPGDRLAYFDALWPLLNWEYAALCASVSTVPGGGSALV